MITDNLVVNGLIKVTSQAEVNTLTVDQVNDTSGEDIAQLQGATSNVQEQINALATSYDESIENSTEFKTGVANAVNSLSDEPNLNSESTLEQYVTAISLLGGKNYKGRLTASDDLDNVSDDGFYDIVSTDQPVHIPSDCGGMNACVEVFNLPEIETIYQRYHIFQGGVFTYSRRKFNGAWSNWVAYTFGVKGNAEASYRSGNVNITPENIGAMSNSPYAIEFKGDTNYHNGGVLDFHFDQSNTDYTSRIIEDASGQININGVKFKSGTVTGTLSGNASSATKLQTARTIFGKSFDGSANVEGKAFVYGNYNSSVGDRYASSALEIRENGLVGSAQSDFGYAPSIGFHWSGRIAATLSLHSDGLFYFRKQDNVTRATIDANVQGNASSAYKNYLPRVAKSCAYQPGANIGIWEEFAAGDSYSLPNNAWYHIFTGQGADPNYNTQLALGMTTTNIAYRNRDAGTWGSWQTVLTSGNYKSYCTPANIGAAASSHTHSGYMPNPWANGTLYLIGDDVYMGDNNVAGCLVIKGNNGDSGIQFNPYSGSTPQKISINGSGLMSITGNLSVEGTINGKHWWWSGQSGQPNWIWGGNDGANMYVYNPSNFSVNYANSAGNADTLDGNHASAFASANHSHTRYLELVKEFYFDTNNLGGAYTYHTGYYVDNRQHYSNIGKCYLILITGCSSSSSAYGNDDCTGAYIACAYAYGTNSDYHTKVYYITLGASGTARWSLISTANDLEIVIKLNANGQQRGRIWMMI